MQESAGVLAKPVKYLRLECSGTELAVPYPVLREILVKPEVHHIPCSNKAVLGIINFHGTPVAAVSLAGLLNLPENSGSQAYYVFNYSGREGSLACFRAGLFHGITSGPENARTVDLPGLFYNSGIMKEKPGR